MKRRRLVLSECPYFAAECPATSCGFCDHCESVFWDYTNGIYMIICGIDEDVEKGAVGECECFEEKGAEE